MRLTLRTLLAYLEDALPAESTKKIGRMIARSSGAKRVVRRIRKVVRRRRLIAVKPDSDSRRGMDANDMAEYLDNILPEEEVHRVERRCLKHDALLAEAAACHQILSRVLGEAPAVNEEARKKAYAAVGILSVTPTNVAVVGSPTTPETNKTIVGTEEQTPDLPIPTLALPESTAGRAALVTLVALLFVALGVVLWRGTEPGSPAVADSTKPNPVADRKAPDSNPKDSGKDAVAQKSIPDKSDKELAVVLDRNKTPQLVVSKTPASEIVGKAPEVPPKSSDSDAAKKVPPPAPNPVTTADVPDVKQAVVKAADYTSASGVLCRLKPEGPERLQTGAPVMVGDSLVNLDGSRSLLTVGKSAFDLVDEAKVVIRSGPQPVFELVRGRFVFRSVDQPTTFRLGVGREDVAVQTTKPNSLLTFEHPLLASVSGAEPSAAILVGAVSHEVTLEYNGRKLNLKPGQVVDVSSGSGIGTPHSEAPPVWLTGSQLTANDLKAADRLAERNAIPFGTQGIVAALQAKVSDRNRDVRKMAIRALATVEAYSAVVDALGDTRFNDNRASALAALRPVVQSDAAGTEAIRRALLHSLPATEADAIIQLIKGYTRQDFTNPRVGKFLLESLDSELLPIRELSIRNLRELTGKDFGYSPTEPAARRASAVKQAENFLRERR